MMHLDQYPAAVQAAIRRFAPVSMRWAIASNLSLEDVRQEIAAAVLSGENPAAVVPAAIGLRRLSSGWRSNDPSVAAQLVDSVIDEESFAGEVVASVAKVDASGLATALIGGTEAVARQSGIGRRAGQMRVKAQLQRFEICGDLFVGESAPSEAQGDASGVATVLGGTEAVASRGGIWRRAAKARVKEQLRRFDLIGDLFGGPLHD